METSLASSVPTSNASNGPLMVSVAESGSLSPVSSPSSGFEVTPPLLTAHRASSYPIHKSSLMSSSPPAATTAGSPLSSETRLSPGKESALVVDPHQPSSASFRDGTESVASSLSDVETFNGKIVYNPDGSAYIIEGPDSDGSEVEAEISQEGSIIDARGLSPNYGTISFPQIVSAFHISRSSELYSALCNNSSLAVNSTTESKVSEVPVMHSYRVFSLRNKSSDNLELVASEQENGLDREETDGDEEAKLRASNCSTVPVKPILMCFICKLSFGYTKSFVAHAIGEHHLTLNEDEKRVLAAKNTSAIIQGVGKEKEPLLSFLKPKSSPTPFGAPPTSHGEQQLDAQQLLAVQMAAVASALRSSSLSSHSAPSTVSPSLPNPSDPVQSLNTSDESTSLGHSKKTLTKGNNAETPKSESEPVDSMPSPGKQPTEAASQFASDLADLANLEKFAKAAAAAAAQQQQMDLHSIAAAMAAAVAVSNANPSQNRTPSPSNKNTSPKSGPAMLNSGQLPTVSSAGSFPGNISLFSNGSDADTSTLLATVANHVAQRPTLTASHPPLLMQHSRNSCKTLKCPKCNWHYKYQETLEIHMKEKHPENEMNCIYCLTNQPHPRLARGETYTCGYKPYRCEVCNYSTTTKGNLSIHMQSDKHINNVQELQNGNIPANAEHLLQSQALAAAVAQASAAAAAANGTGTSQGTSSSCTATSTTMTSSNSASPVPTSSSMNLAAMAVVAAQQDAKCQLQKIGQPSPSSSQTPPSTPNNSNGKQKATWRCDVCNYETNVARNLRIHMTSEKHTHNIMVLKQSVSQMQQLSAIQQGIITPEMLQFNPNLLAAAAAAAGLAGIGNPNPGSSGSENSAGIQPEVALADMAYNHALLMMASQQQQRTMAAFMHQQQQQVSNETKSPMLAPNGMQPTFDLDQQPDPALAGVANSVPLDESCRLYHCCVCGTFTADSIDALSQHIQCDRTRTREDEVLVSVGGSYICKLCSYKTNLKANFQLHCKTDKHLQRLQHVNHIKEGGPQAEWKLTSMPNPVQVIRCNVCNYYTNSIHKLQLHSANPRHDVFSRIFNHLQLAEISFTLNNTSKYYYCALCSLATRTKITLIQHLTSFRHVRNENLRQLKHQQSAAAGMKDSEDEIREMFLVKELRPGDKITFENDDESGLSPSLGTEQSCSGDQQLLKNALMEQARLGLSDLNDQSTCGNALSCPFCPFSNSSEMRMQMHIITAHPHQTQQQANNECQGSNRHTCNTSNSPPPSILCPLCQEPFQEKDRLENHLFETHNVNKEGVQRLMLLVDTSELDKFLTAKQNKELSDDSRRDTSDSQANEDEDLRHNSPDDELLEANSLMATSSNTILEYLVCPTCNRMCLSLDELFAHLSSESHHIILSGGQFQCWRVGCSQVFKSVSAVQQHFKEQHVMKSSKLSGSASNAAISDRHVYKYRCSRCSLAFKTFEKFQLHSQYHLIRAATQCVICGRSFRSVDSLQKHVESSHADMSEEEMEQYRTSLVNNQLLFALGRNGGILDPATTELLKKESCRADFPEDESMECIEEENLANDGTSKENAEQLEMGESADNGPTVNGNMSENCLEEYLNSQTVAEDSYNDPNRKFKCHRCKVAFTRQSYLTSHNKTLLHRKGEKMSYPMEKYLDPNRPFKCEICKESFTQKNILLVHYNSVSHLHRLKQSMKESSAAVAAAVAASGSPGEPECETSGDGENKPFRCNLCKVSFNQASSLHVHLRSTLHQTRTSKLHELAQSGQLDLSVPLIEPPPTSTLETNNNLPSKANANDLSTKTVSSACASPNSNKLPDMLANLTNEQQQAFAFQQAALNFAFATGHNNAQSPIMPITGHSPFTCVKCGAAFISQDAQLQHQQLCGLFGNVPSNSNSPVFANQAKQQIKILNPQASAPLYKNKPHLYKHLLETWGFEIVMQFNESHQKKDKPDTAEEVKEEEEEEPEKETKEHESDNDNVPPEINRCQCDICFKEFSSIWVLKAHREEIHKDVVPLDVVESFADEYRTEYERKFGSEDEPTEESAPTENSTAVTSNNVESNEQEAGPSHNGSSPASCVQANAESSANLNPMTPSVPQLAQLLPNLPPNASPADIAAANQMAAQLQFGQLLMSMGLAGMAAGMPMNAGMNVPFAAAAMAGIPPQLIPMIMADPMMAAAAAFNNPALAAAAAAQLNPAVQVPVTTSAPGTPSPAPTNQVLSMPGQLPPVLATQAAASAAQQQKRARTRISDEQLKVLRQYFDINNSPTEEQLIEMSHKSGLPMKVIKHWFRNTLFKERQRNKDSPYNFNNPPSTFLNLDEYEKTGEAKVFTLDDLKKTENSDYEKDKLIEKQNEFENEPECKISANDLKSSSSNKDTDYATSDDEDVKRIQVKEVLEPKGELCHLQKQQTQLQVHMQPAQEFDQLSKAMALNISSPQPSESSMSSNSETTMSHTTTNTTSSLFAGLTSFSSVLPPTSNMAHSPLQMAFDAAQRGQLTPNAMMSSSNSSSHSSSGKRANRTRFTDYQIKVLQEFFESNAYPKDDDLEYLSKLLNLSPRVIVVWFQNARQKARKVYENQPPTTPIEDDGTGRFQRTPGLNYQCKKCLQVFQRYYELIKHQKSSCFKDENPLAAQIRMAAEARAQATSPSVSTPRDNPSTPIDCSRSATTTPEKVPTNLLPSPCSVTSPSPSISSKNSPNSNDGQTFRCDKCTMVFNRFDLWRDHQIVHIVNTNIFTNTTNNPFGLMHLPDGQPGASQLVSSQPQILSPGQMMTSQSNKRKTDDEDDEMSRDSLSGNGGSNCSDQMPRDKRLRTTILPEQLDYLYQKYQVDSNPSRKMLESIAKEVGLKKRVVQVWFQNTRARERKGQFRAHQQVIHKRCPFCRALFKARSALESHLATRHADQYTKGDINIDALPDGDPNEDGDVPMNEANMDSSQMADVMKRYEDSFKKYLDELNIQGKDGNQLPSELTLKMKSALEQVSMHNVSSILNPLDLSHPAAFSSVPRQCPNGGGDDESYDDSRSSDVFDSDFEEEIDFDCSQSSNPSSPSAPSRAVSSSLRSHTSPGSSTPGGTHRGAVINSNSKRFRTQMTTVMLKVMKSIFADYKTPTMAECEALGREIGLPKRVVQVWFQNARAKEKKARIAFVKAFGQDFDSQNPTIEECKICDIKYNYKVSTTAMQEHLFSKSHLEKLKLHIDSVKKMIEGQEDNSADFPVASGHPIPPTMLVNPHSTAFSASSLDSSKAANILQQLHLIQGLTAASQTAGPIGELFNGTCNGEVEMSSTEGSQIKQPTSPVELSESCSQFGVSSVAAHSSMLH